MAQATYPKVETRRAGTSSLPIWSCSVWGLPCPVHYCAGGALLPHLFTLTASLRTSSEGAATACACFALASGSSEPALAVRSPTAVCFLWHFPSGGFHAAIPDVIRHTALRS